MSLRRAAVVLAAAAAGCAASGPGQPYRLRTEYMEDPRGLDVSYAPRLTWALAHAVRGEQQKAYQVAVSEFTHNGWNGVYDSGMVESNASQNVHLGAKLTPGKLYSWSVRYYDFTGALSPWATNATFSTALSKWTASWIGSSTPGSFLARTAFHTTKPIARATAYIVGLGYYKLFVNSQKVSDHELGAFTTYEKRVYYDTYDVTEAMAAAADGAQAVGVSVGTGWYAQKTVASGQESLLCQIEVLYKDGSTSVVVSDKAGWKVAPSPVTSVDIFVGETYDASLEQPGWHTSQFVPGSEWVPAVSVPAPGSDAGPAALTSHAVQPPIRIGQSYPACDLWESSPGVFVFDFCQNMAGITTLKIAEKLLKPGQVVKMQHAEILLGPKPAGIQHHYRSPCNETDQYIARGGEAVEYTTQFTYAGFRYVAMEGYPGTPDKGVLTAHFVHTDYARTGAISFSDPLLTKVQEITTAAAMSNYMSIPTDCPQRERRGWLGDAQLSCETNIHNFDMAAPYTSFVQQIADAQATDGAVPDCVPWYHHGYLPADPAWGGAFVLIADWVGTYYHDDQIFATHYDAIIAHTNQLVATAQSDKDNGLLAYGGWGDWCPPDGCRSCWKGSDAGRQDGVNSVLVSSFYFILELRVVAKYAAILGKHDDAAKYSKLAEAAAVAFNHVFYDPVAKTYTENRTCAESLGVQTTISLAAALGVIPAEDYDAVIDTLVADVAAHGFHLNVGIVGVKYLLPALSAGGRGDVALMIAQQRTPPSYIYMVEQGATTLWETWTGSTYDAKASRNHIMYGSNSDWYFKYLAGIGQAEGSRGWQKLQFKPEVWSKDRGVSICANLSSTEASIITPRGEVSAAWACSSLFEYNVTVPVGSTATVVLPQFGESVSITEHGSAVWKNNHYIPGVAGISGGALDKNGNVVFSSGSGTYSFHVTA